MYRKAVEGESDLVYVSIANQSLASVPYLIALDHATRLGPIAAAWPYSGLGVSLLQCATPLQATACCVMTALSQPVPDLPQTQQCEQPLSHTASRAGLRPEQPGLLAGQQASC